MRGEKETLDAYMVSISGYPRILRKRELELSKIIQKSKDPQAIDAAVNELVLANLKLVVHCLKDYMGFLDSPDVSISEMDLVSEGNIALLAAARGYDAFFNATQKSQEGTRFSTYACACIRSRMQRAIKTSRLVRIPERHFTYRRKLKSVEELLGQDASDEEISDMMGIGTNRLEMVRISSRCKVFRFEDIQTEDDESSMTIDSLPDTEHLAPDIEIEKKDLLDYLKSLVAKLKPRTQTIISEMFLSDSKATLQDLSEQFKVSRERCRQICVLGLNQMRKMIKTQMQEILGASSYNSSERRVSNGYCSQRAGKLLFNAIASCNQFYRDVA